MLMIGLSFDANGAPNNTFEWSANSAASVKRRFVSSDFSILDLKSTRLPYSEFRVSLLFALVYW